MLFSILVASVPGREAKLVSLLSKLYQQANGKPVEVLTLIDNKKRSIGRKRDNLVQLAQGDYLAFVDDDDDVADNYVSAIVEKILDVHGVDVICIDQKVYLNDEEPFIVRFDMRSGNEQCYQKDGRYQNITRPPFQVCAWRSELAKSERFLDLNYDEDGTWLRRIWPKVRTQASIEGVLHIYRYSETLSQAKGDHVQ